MKAFAIAGLAAAVVAGSVVGAAAELSPRSNYILRCTGCHGLEGLGTEEGGVPSFPGSVGKIANIDSGRTYMMHVPGVVASSLTNAEIAEVMNYVLTNFDETDAEPFTEEEVVRRRAVPFEDIVEERRQVVIELREMGVEIAEYPWP